MTNRLQTIDEKISELPSSEVYRLARAMLLIEGLVTRNINVQVSLANFEDVSEGDLPVYKVSGRDYRSRAFRKPEHQFVIPSLTDGIEKLSLTLTDET